MSRQADHDLSFIDLPKFEDPLHGEDGAPPNASLYAKELAAYGEFDDQDDEAFERKVRHAFLARELQQIDEIVASRKSYANKIYWLVVCWLIGMGLVILLVGFKEWTKFEVDTKVVLALIGGTTLNVLGIFTIVTNFLFPKNGHSIFSRGSEFSNKKKKGIAQKKEQPAAAKDPVED